MSLNNIDLDDLELSKLSADQLAELAEFIDPDNELLPASDRLPDHTKKKPTGPYDRSHLLAHLKSQAEKSTIGDDYVPFVKKTPSSAATKDQQACKETPAKKEVKTEFDDMLDMLDEDDLTELASELGIHSLLNQAQSRGDEKPVANPSTGLHKPSATYSHIPSSSKFEEEDPQDTDIEDSIASLEANDPSLTELNLNNHSKLDSNLIDDLIQALSENTQLETLQMTNVKFTDDHAEAIGRVLKTNTTLKVVNLESNRLTPKGIKFVMRGIAENPETSLKELRLANQYFAGGARAESEIAKYLEKIKTITKLGYNFAVPSYRTKVDAYIMRNTDYIRKKRASLVV